MSRKINFAMMDKRTKLIIAGAIIGITVVSVTFAGIAIMNIPPGPTPSNAPTFSVVADNLQYDEDLDLTVLKSGDLLYEYTLMDHGLDVLNFPVDLGAPANFSYDGIIDTVILLEVTEISPLDASNGPIYENPSSAIGEGLFSHIKVTIIIYLNNTDNETVFAQPCVDYIMGNLTSYFSTEFYMYDNDTYTSSTPDYWTTEFIGFPTDFPAIWAKLPGDTLTLNHSLTTLNLGRIRNSPFKQLSITADWDEHTVDSGNDLMDLDERWEFTCSFNFLAENIINIIEGQETSIKFTDIFDITGSITVPSYVNTSTLNIGTYHGSMIESSTPGGADMTDFNLELITALHRTLSGSDGFGFSDNKLNSPCVKLIQTANSTFFNEGEEILITYIVENIGTVTAYDIDIVTNIDSDIGASDHYLVVSGEPEPLNIDSLIAGSSVEKTFIINATSSTTNSEWYTAYINYEDYYNNGYTTYGNQLFIRKNTNPSNLSTLVLDMNYITDIDVGDEVIFNGTITNLDDYVVTNVNWIVDDTLRGYNTSSITGTINSIAAHSTAIFSFSIKIDTFNRLFGEYHDSLISINWDNETGDVSAGPRTTEMNMNIHPMINSEFGPMIIIIPSYSISSPLKGGIITVSVDVKNVGDMIADDVILDIDYWDGSTPSPIFEVYGGLATIAFGPLEPGEEFTHIYKVKLLVDFDNENSIRIPIEVDYYGGFNIPGGYYAELISYPGLHNVPLVITPTNILSIVLGIVGVIAIIEAGFIFKKSRNPL